MTSRWGRNVVEAVRAADLLEVRPVGRPVKVIGIGFEELSDAAGGYEEQLNPVVTAVRKGRVSAEDFDLACVTHVVSEESGRCLAQEEVEDTTLLSSGQFASFLAPPQPSPNLGDGLLVPRASKRVRTRNRAYEPELTLISCAIDHIRESMGDLHPAIRILPGDLCDHRARRQPFDYCRQVERHGVRLEDPRIDWPSRLRLTPTSSLDGSGLTYVAMEVR